MESGQYGPDYSIAVLYRTNAQSRALEEACVRKNLPYVIFGTATSFYKRMEIKDCLSYLRWLYNGRDRVAMARAMTTPKRGLGEIALAEFDRCTSQVEEFHLEHFPDQAQPTPLDILISLSQAQTEGAPDPSEYLSPRSLRIFRDFSEQIHQLRELAYQQSLDKVLAFVIEEFELMQHLDKISNSDTEFEERKANVDELKQAAERYKTGACLTNDEESPLGSFLDDVALVTDMADRSVQDRFALKLMTIHGSKGMEFDSVFVVGNEEGTFPTGLVRLCIVSDSASLVSHIGVSRRLLKGKDRHSWQRNSDSATSP